jgi:hypothetical protein
MEVVLAQAVLEVEATQEHQVVVLALMAQQTLVVVAVEVLMARLVAQVVKV